jgi:hypothetical protein
VQKLVNPIIVKRKPGPASKTRPDIRERWRDQVSCPASDSIETETDGKKRPASLEELEAKKRRMEGSGIPSDCDVDIISSEEELSAAPAPTTSGVFLKKGRNWPPTGHHKPIRGLG